MSFLVNDWVLLFDILEIIVLLVGLFFLLGKRVGNVNDVKNCILNLFKGLLLIV